ncbi:AAA family ATPase [Shewanella donghaensis]|uniref:AAA family ATPase n=1 Tax=Shewanella donghaensis TaxID=238836 RepID=UPI001183A1AC|nr:AAA family ATPase [Shewanella donghaensis]
MRKILLFGNSASGKSTLAKSLVQRENLAHLDLDTLAWQKTIPPQREALTTSNITIQKFIKSANKGWIIEGCYTDLLELTVTSANEVIFMNLPIEVCIENAKKRPWEPHKYESKQAQDANLAMLLDWISQYNQRTDTFSQQSHQDFYDRFKGTKTMLINNG